MFYRCKDCGGNAVYDPKKKKMVCESCGNEETQEKYHRRSFIYAITVERRLNPKRQILL